MHKYFLIPLLLSKPLFAENIQKTASSLNDELDLFNKPAATAVSKSGQSNSVIMISPESRAQDIKQAYDLMRREKSTANIGFKLKDGQVIARVIDMTIMDKGSLILFKANTSQGVKYMVVPIEDITGIEQQ